MNSTYLLFINQDYYPLGGWNDLAGKYDSLTQAIDGIGLYDDFNIVEVDWHHGTVEEVEVEDLSYYKERMAAEKKKMELKSYSNLVRQAQPPISVQQRKKDFTDREIGPEATNAFIILLGDHHNEEN